MWSEVQILSPRPKECISRINLIFYTASGSLVENTSKNINPTNTYHSNTSGTTSLSKATLTMCLFGAIFYCYEYYLRVAPSVMSEELKQAFSLNDAALGNLAACYYYAYTPLQIPVGIMMDKFGPRRILTFACALCVLGTYFFATTSDLLIAQIGRFLVGFGSAFAYVGVLKISNLWLPKKYFALMAGICSALGMFGGMSGELIMAFSVEKIGWQSTLTHAIWIGIGLTFVLWFTLRDKRENTLKAAEGLKKNTISVRSSLFEIINNKQLWMAGIIGCLTFLPISAFAEMWAVPYFESIGMTRQEGAFGSSMIFLGFALGGPVWGILSDKFSTRRFPLILGAMVSAVLLALVICMPASLGKSIHWILFLSGFFASSEILVFAIANDLSRREVSATAASFTNMVVMLGAPLLLPLIGKLLDNSVKGLDGLNASTKGVENYGLALLILPIMLLIAAVLSACLKESYHKSEETESIKFTKPEGNASAIT